MVPAGSYHCTVVGGREGMLQIWTGSGGGGCVAFGCVHRLEWVSYSVERQADSGAPMAHTVVPSS
jgi:hypothetical protein